MILRSNKHTPPVINSRIHFDRQRLLHQFKTTGTLKKNIQYIEAQAGQGKSTLAAQYLNEVKAPFVWYQIDTEDSDGLCLLKNLYEGLSTSFSGFHSRLLADMIEKNEITSGDCHLYSDILNDALSAYINGPHYIIFDDLYKLEEGSPAGIIIDALINSGINDLHFILISRSPVDNILPGTKTSDISVVFTDTDLAMTKSEIAEFFNEMTDIPVSRDLIKQLHRITEGWTMGVLTKAHSILKSARLPLALPDKKPDKVNLKVYFKAEILQHLSEDEITGLSRLSFLKTIPIDLAEPLSGNPEILNILDNLITRNYFTRYTGPDRTEVVFHHLFQECLTEYVIAQSGEIEISELYNAAADWYYTKNQPENGIIYYIKANNYAAADQAVKKSGIELYANNCGSRLLKALQAVPEEKLLNYGWLSCFFGLAIVDQNPPEALRFFKKAEILFTKEDDKAGLLIVCSQLIHFHTWIDSMFSEGEKYLPIAETLYDELAESLPVQVKISSLYCLACGYTVFKSDFLHGEQYSRNALDISVENKFDNYTAMIRIILCYQFAFAGDLKRFASELETLSKMTTSGRISTHNILLINLAWLMYLELKGDFFTYRAIRDHLLKTIENNLAVKSILRPFIMLWDLDMKLAEGDYNATQKLADEALDLPDAAQAPHFRSQFLHFKALADALSGDTENAKEAAIEAIQSRIQAGSPFFITHTGAIAGGALAVSGHTKQAESILKNTIKTAKTLGGVPERQGAALAHYIGLNLSRNRVDREDIETFTDLMKKHNYTHLVSLTPALLKQILEAALKLNIQPDFVKQLAMKRLNISVTDEGMMVPLLKIKTLGELCFEKNGEMVLTAKDFTASQLKLLAMLISSQHGYLNVDDIQTTFWPEKSATKGRASFDTMLSRLRKVLKGALAPQPVNCYFNLKKEQLFLDNTIIDIDEFITYAKQGLQHANAKEFRQAENEFRRAFTLFSGSTFLPGVILDQNAHKFKEYILQPLFNDCAGTWSKIMLASPDCLPVDMALMEKMITADSGNIELLKNLYQLKSIHESNIAATRLIKKYKETLRVEGFFADEIEEIVESIWDN